MKKTLVKSILLAIFGMMVVQNVNAQKISAGEEVATNIGPGLGVGECFYYDNILYEVETVVSSGNYEAKAVAFYGESLPAEIEIIGGGQANSCSFTVTEIKALNSVKKMSGTSYVEGDASALDAITTLIFVKEDGFGGFAGTIGKEAFGNLDNLRYIYSELTTPPTAASDAFTNLNIDDYDEDYVQLIVPAGTIGKYGTAKGWEEFYQIRVEGNSQLFGDVNNDGDVDSQDLIILRNYLKDEDDEGLNLDYLDINSDGDIDGQDYILLRNRQSWL